MYSKNRQTVWQKVPYFARPAGLLLGMLAVAAPAPQAQAGLNNSGWSYISSQGNAGFGANIVSIGDFNHDSRPDVALAASGWTPPGATSRQGAVFIWLGTGSGYGLANTPNYMLTADNFNGSGFAASVASGDVNNDGYDDVIVGASAEQNVGAVYVFYGRAGMPTGSQPTQLAKNWKYVGTNLGPYFGWSVASDADINCDGVEDILVTSHAAYGPTNSCQELADLADGNNKDDNYTGVYAGAVVAFYGIDSTLNPPPASLPSTPSWSSYGRVYLSEFGWDVDTVGDFNGDGCGDFVVGSPRWGWYEANRGSIDLFLGQPDNPSVACDGPVRSVPMETYMDDFVLDYQIYGARFGVNVNKAGDINADGLDDFIVSSSGYEDNSNSTDEGGFWIIYGIDWEDGNLTTLPTVPFDTGNQSSSNMGAAAAWAGDVNLDGCTDVVVGAPGYDYTASNGAYYYNEGRIYLYLGSDNGLVFPAAATFDSLGYWANGGQGLSGIGDVDGDGKNEILMGAPGWDTAYGVNLGKLFLLDYTPDAPVVACSVMTSL